MTASATGVPDGTVGAARDPWTGRLAADLRLALVRVVRRVRVEKSDDALSDGQYAVLAALDRHGALTSAALAEHERVRPPSMTRTVACLLDAGLVDRTAHPEDGRAQMIALTPTGQSAVDETRRLRDDWLGRRLAELDEADLAVLARATDILNRVADA